MKTTTNRAWALLAATALLAPAALQGQSGVPHVSSGYTIPSASSDFEHSLFTPELIMRHYRAIGLSAEQRGTITQAIQTLQSTVVDPQWRLMETSQNLTELLAASAIDEAAALSAIDEVLRAEAEIKRANIAALIRIKSALTQEQRETLMELRGPGLPWGIFSSGLDPSTGEIFHPAR